MPYDADYIRKIWLPKYDQEDFISWMREKHGMFTVRSAYNLALDLRNGSPPNSSTNLYGDRGLWKTIWATKTPPKVKIFTSKLATNNLVVQVNRCKRLPNLLLVCSICGMEAETGYHATMMCTKAKELRQALAKDWKLPSEADLTFAGDDWVLVLLDKVAPEMRDKLMFIWWRSWHHQNDIIFGKGDSSIVNSSRFLQNYLCTLRGSAKGNVVKDGKGKALAANWVVN
jgi:hypothetical protein